MSVGGFNGVSNVSDLIGAFDTGTSRVAFEMGSDGAASSIPGLGIQGNDVVDMTSEGSAFTM